MRTVKFPPLSAPSAGLTLLLISTVCLPVTQTHVAKSRGPSTGANDVFFVYTGLSPGLVANARRLGRSFRRNFVNSLESGELRSEEQEIQFYARQFAQCASVEAALDLTEEGITKTLRDAARPESLSPGVPVQRLLQLLNLDAVSAGFLLLPIEEQEASIRQACAVNELKFQCAYGFINSAERMRKHLSQMKKTDGNFKVMAERECPLADLHGQHHNPRNESVYSCVARSASDILSLCEDSVAAYNTTRQEANGEIRRKFQSAISAIDLRLMAMSGSGAGGGDRPLNQEALDRVLKESELFMYETLSDLIPLEAVKCGSFMQLETCILNSISALCPKDAISIVDAMTTLLRVGYFARERDEFLHQHLIEAGVEPHLACRQLSY